MAREPSRFRRFMPLVALVVAGACTPASPLDQAIAEIEKTSEEALERLEALVPTGSIDTETIAAIRAARTATPPGRFVAVCDDARALIESGRLAPGTKLTIQMPRALGSRAPRPTGSAAAELIFVDRNSSRTVARLAETSKAHLGNKNDEIKALIAWLQQDPEQRDLELVVVSGGASGITFDPPPALPAALPALTAAGLADRQLLRVDGKPMTVGEWVKLQ